MADATKKSADNTAGNLPAPSRPFGSGIVKFGREVYREGVEKVTWPTWKETYLTTIVVFIMVTIMMTFFYGVDALLGLGETWLVGALH
ncbi:MAG TPA: preprotein translocase subunit SecE [Rhizomicrobium sp.]